LLPLLQVTGNPSKVRVMDNCVSSWLPVKFALNRICCAFALPVNGHRNSRFVKLTDWVSQANTSSAQAGAVAATIAKKKTFTQVCFIIDDPFATGQTGLISKFKVQT
jgi:hypothetical protein